MQYQEMEKLLNWTNGVPSDQTFGIPFVVANKVIRSHLRQEHLNR
jgi:hypothetical protein